MLVLVGNGRLILERLGLIGSTSLIREQVSTRIDWGLSSFQSFRFSANAADLVVWGIVGLIIYSALEALVKSIRTVQFRRDFDSARYIHPQGYSSASFWQEVTTNAILGFLLLVCMVAGGILYVVASIPASFAYVQRFILRPNFFTAFDFLAGLAIAFVATTVMYLLIKLVVRHHRISQFVE